MNPHGQNPDQNHDELDLLMNDVLHDYANPATPDDFASRTIQRSLAMNMELAPVAPGNAANNLLTFGTLDRTAGRRMSPQSIGIAVLLNLAALLLLMVQVRSHALLAPRAEMIALVAPLTPPPAPPKLEVMGGGGGNPGVAPVSKGNPPKPSVEQLNPPKAQVDAKLKLDTTIDIDPNLKMSHNDMPNIGLTNSPLIGNSLGNGTGAGLGSGNGSGIGLGSGGNMGGGLRHIGGGVSRPEVLFAPEPEFSEEARKAKVSGNVLVYLQVDANGRPTHVRILRGLGLGLDEKAIEAVSRYKFKPAMENGKPVAVEMQVNVDFQIF